MFAEVFALELRVNAQQGKHVHGIAGHTRGDGVVVFQIASGATKTGAEHHAQAPRPTLGDAQTPLRWRDQGDADQAVVDQQADGGQVLQKVLFDQFTHRRPHPLLVAGALGFEQVAEGRLVAIGLIEQRAGFAGIAAVEHMYVGDGCLGFRHDGESPRGACKWRRSCWYEPCGGDTVPHRYRPTRDLHRPVGPHRWQASSHRFLWCT
ncbi:hypothetical protein D3C81_1622530 [compost metagenome]